jgi:hypothetical protein
VVLQHAQDAPQALVGARGKVERGLLPAAACGAGFDAGIMRD